MIDGQTSVVHPSDGAKEELTLESIAVAGASAIQRLISERDDLRVRVNTQQGDLVQLTAANVELRRCIISIRQHYIELATKVLGQLEQFDQATRDLMQERQTRIFAGRDDDANLVSLAHRLKPAGTRPNSVASFDD
jgi:hypothetical protein